MANLRAVFRIFNKTSFSTIRRNCSHSSSYDIDATKEYGGGLVLGQQVGPVRMIGINRPESKNCVNTPTAEALLEAFQEFDEDENSKAAVLHGYGGTFCAGYDLKEVAEIKQHDFETYGRGPMGISRFEVSKPVVGAIEGYAVAGGMELALWCDLRVMDETAVMGVFCRRFGVPLLDGGTVRLPAIVGLGRALDLILTGRPIRPAEAMNWGLVNLVSTCGTAVGEAVKMARSLANFPQECLRADRKSAINSVYSTSLQDALRFEHEEGIKIIDKESISGARKFVDGEGRHGKFNLKLNAEFD